MFCHSSPTAAELQPAGQRSLNPHGLAVKARAEIATASIKAVGSQERAVRLTQVKCRVKAVMFAKPKMLLAVRR